MSSKLCLRSWVVVLADLMRVGRMTPERMRRGMSVMDWLEKVWVLPPWMTLWEYQS